MEIQNQPQTRRRSPVITGGSETHRDPAPPADDRPERATPYHLPHGYHTEAELAAFIHEHEPEEEP